MFNSAALLTINSCSICDEFWKDRKPVPKIMYSCTECKCIVCIDNISRIEKTENLDMTAPIIRMLERLQLKPKVPTAQKAIDIKTNRSALKVIPEEPAWSSSYKKRPIDKSYSNFYSD